MKISRRVIITLTVVFLLLILGVTCFFEYKKYHEQVKFMYILPSSQHYFPFKTIIDKIDKYYITRDVGVVVRSVGERTEKPCIEDLVKWFGSKNVYVIKNVTPLSKATKQTMEYIQKTDKKWFLIVDADVLFFEDKLMGFIKSAKYVSKHDPKALCFQGLLYDKFLFKDRRVGFILYNKKNLNYKESYMEQCYNEVRPETCLRKILISTGYNAYMLNDVRIGLHAFNQYPKTIVKNGIMYAKKHDIQNLIPVWKEKSSSENDMKYILIGVQIYNSLKNKNIIPDNDAMENLMEKYEIPDLPYVHRKTMDKNLEKYNNSVEFAIVDKD